MPREGDLDAQTIAVTYGYSRDHRDDLKQWMLALVTTGEGVPQFLKPLDGNASDKTVLPQVIVELTRQLQASGEAAGLYVADSGLYSEANMCALNAVGVQWVSRVPRPPAWLRCWCVRIRWPAGNRARTASCPGGAGPSSCPRARSAGWWCAHGRANNGPGRPSSGRPHASGHSGRNAGGT